ncbi:CdaR family protein [Paenibacillus sinopodophylli]|uniref:CdaR family protein n=1 Tax=Paenibacillus sinopodophylli TaxID=1837342 RepID=UPI00110CA34E|nr:CdaR family protein [Paenibacillus sinopodophylli]
MDKWLSHPTALKIISVIVGLLLWAVVHIDPDTSPQTVTSNVDTKTIEASVIKAEGLDTDKYVLTAMEPTVVRLDVQGRLSNLLKASSDADYVVSVDLKDAKPGIQELPLVASLPKGITLVEMSPRTVTVQIEEILTKPFELKVVATGKPATGYVVGASTIVAPTTDIQVTLPKDDMSRVGVVETEISIDGADKTAVNKKAKIVVYDTDGIEMTNAVISPETAHVEVKVTPPFKSLPLQVRYTGTLPEGLSLVSVKPAIDQVTVYGEQKRLDELQVYDGVVLDLSKVKQTGSVQVKTEVIDGIKSIDPAEVTLEVVVAPIITRTFAALPITLEGVPSGMSAVFRTPAGGKFDLTVSGAGSVLNALQPDALAVIANVEGLNPGIHSVTLQIDVPAYVQTVLGSGQTLTVSIEIIEDAATGTGEDDAEEVGGTPTEEPPTPTPTSSPDTGEESNNGSGNASSGPTMNP